MFPSQAILNQIVTLLASDTTTLAAVSAMKLHIAKASFTPGAGLDIGTLMESDFGGYAAIAIGIGTQTHYLDPVTGLLTIDMLPPVGGFHFQVTSGSNLPQSAYGWYLTDNAGAVLYASGIFPTPIPLSAVGQGFDVSEPLFRFAINSPF